MTFSNEKQSLKTIIPATTSYTGITSLYFYSILSTIIKIGGLKSTNKTILDFGCGYGTLKKLLPGSNVIGYDIVPEYSDVKDWRTVQIDIFVANQVFYALQSSEVENILLQLRQLNPSAKLIIGTSRKGLLNKIGMFLFNKRQAHDGYKLEPKDELLLLSKHCKLLSRRSIFFLTDVSIYSFK